ncbi:hypothetical protein Q2T40_11575 [Winogradskyella maritima]|uniref:RimK family alpha-L-glutamate ligase n=1 Tax=Winogradskyella maritima TaxID=1517766 RepID=A0ABV8AHW5_9FLAO|nr:hypothetical protein [Winogradskyella maritima]
MKHYDVVVLTDHRYLNDSDDPYKHNVFFEDQLVVEALKREGLKTTRKAWDDKDFDWSLANALLFRSTWDYFDRFATFEIWLNKVSKTCRLINSEALLRWNIDKHYLADLHEKGIHIPETHYIEIGTNSNLKQLHEKLGWQHTVLKPRISGAARHTYQLTLDTLNQHEGVFQTLIAKEAMLLQAFQTHIVTKGELSLMLFGGQFSHAVLKKAKAGDFRVQDDFGGTVESYKPTPEEINFTEDAVKACPELPIYARVDIFEDNYGKIALSELELIEPELWFREHPEASDLLAKAIKSTLKA